MIEKIRVKYNVPAKRGMKVIAYGEPGIITGSKGYYVRIRIDGTKRSMPYHPVCGIEYILNGGTGNLL